MKNWKTWKIIVFVALCVCLNIGGKLLAVRLELPIWADAFGTALCAYIAGPVCGAMVGVTGNLAYVMVNHLSAAYAFTSIALGVIVGIAARKSWLEQFYGFMKTASLTIFISLAVSLPINLIVNGGFIGNKWGDAVVEFFLHMEWPDFICSALGQLSIEFADKMITIAAVYLIVMIRRWRREEAGPQATTQSTLPVVVILGLSLALSLPVSAEAQTAETKDYNDYVQSVYSSNNGLPCGEANDIAQTNDGVLWIGTYAGLYRYNGREFQWVDNYESVRNVNCLYVEAERVGPER